MTRDVDTFEKPWSMGPIQTKLVQRARDVFPTLWNWSDRVILNGRITIQYEINETCNAGCFTPCGLRRSHARHRPDRRYPPAALYGFHPTGRKTRRRPARQDDAGREAQLHRRNERLLHPGHRTAGSPG